MLVELGHVVVVADLLNVGQFVVAELLTFERIVRLPERDIEEHHEVRDGAAVERAEQLGDGPFVEEAFDLFAGELGGFDDQGAAGGAAVEDDALGTQGADAGALQVLELGVGGAQQVELRLGLGEEREGIGELAHHSTIT